MTEELKVELMNNQNSADAVKIEKVNISRDQVQ